MSAERVSSAPGTISATVLGRIAPGEDLFAAVREICTRHGIRSGHIATMIGSLRSADVVCVTPDPENPGRAVYLEPLRMEGSIELITVAGIIGLDDRGDLSVHLHGVLAGSDMKPVAGHLADRGENRVLATAEVVINGFSGAEFVRSFDEETGFVLFKVRPTGP